MKTSILLLTLGIVGVIANPVSKQTIQSENKNSVETEISDSQTKQEVINTANKGDQEQKKDKLVENTEPPNTSDTNKKATADETVEIVIEETSDTPIDLSEKCDHGLNTPVETPKINPDSNKYTDGTVDIIIEENLVGSINENPQIFADVPLSPGINENVPPMPGTFETPLNPQFSGLIGDSQPVPQFIEGPQVMEEFLGSPQYPGFIERPQLPGLFGGIPQMPGFIEESPQMPFNDNAQHPDDDANNIIPDDYFSEDMEKIEHEIMETAAGFVPTPLVFRRKQKPKRRFTTRRHFRRNPYRRHQIFYPYYYAYYRPSSLRYY